MLTWPGVGGCLSGNYSKLREIIGNFRSQENPGKSTSDTGGGSLSGNYGKFRLLQGSTTDRNYRKTQQNQGRGIPGNLRKSQVKGQPFPVSRGAKGLPRSANTVTACHRRESRIVPRGPCKRSLGNSEPRAKTGTAPGQVAHENTRKHTRTAQAMGAKGPGSPSLCRMIPPFALTWLSSSARSSAV